MEYFKLSKPGDRNVNEDSVEIFQIGNRTVLALADGLGGHGFGEVASQEALLSVKECFERAGNQGIEQAIREAFLAANQRMEKLQREVGSDADFKTTLVLLVIEGEEFVWGHIGDSRFYHFEEKTLIERSMDHSVPQMLVKAGEIREKDIRHHADRNRLLRVLGGGEGTFNPFIAKKEPLNTGTAFLLCSDGFWEHIEERKMQKVLRRCQSAQDWVEQMEDIVKKNGKGYEMDNYSAITVCIFPEGKDGTWQ